MASEKRRSVHIRSERLPDGTSHMDARLDENGNLVLECQDLGPMTSSVGGDGEYEYFIVISAADLPKTIQLLGGNPDEDVLDFLKREWGGKKSFELEETLRKNKLSTTRVWG